MRIACIYWSTSSVGGIATHLNSLRTAALKVGDTFDILHSMNWKGKRAGLFPNGERKWIRGGDTNIWCDGEIPQREESARWLEANYDAVVFGFICPHETKAYPSPAFLPLYETRLPKVAWVMDGYWDDYSSWAIPLLPKLKGVLCPLESYATPLRKLGVKNLVISAFPFQPAIGSRVPRSETPLLTWINQWKNIKGINPFLEMIPDLPEEVQVHLYSCGIRYYQLRTEETWLNAVGDDLFKGFCGHGRATYYGNVDPIIIHRVLQRAWFTVNLQGMKSKKVTYQRGSYNNTEVEALYYGALPILHSSTLQTDLPHDVYVTVSKGEDIPGVVESAIKSGHALSPRRQQLARDFVLSKHLAAHRYQDIIKLLS